MAFFVLNGQEWPIAEGSQEDPEERIGGSVRSFTGQLRTRVRARLRSWSLRTAELTGVDMADLLDELRGPGTLSITGDWFNAVCRAEIGAEGPVPGDTGFYTLEFRLLEIGEVVGPQLPEDPEQQMELEQELAALNSGLSQVEAFVNDGTLNFTNAAHFGLAQAPADATAALAAANTAALLSGRTLYIPPGNYNVDSNLTLTVPVQMAGVLLPGPGAAVTLQVPPSAPAEKVFGVDRGGSFKIGTVGGYQIDVRWFGALGIGSSEAASALNAALQAAEPSGSVVIVPDGTYRVSAPLAVPGGVTLHITRGARLDINGPIRAIELSEFNSKVINDGEIDVRGFAATGIYADGALGWNTAIHFAAISGEGRIRGNLIAGQTGIHLFADGTTPGSNISFLRVSARVHNCYYGVRLEALNGAWVNGCVLDVDIAGAVYAWHLDEQTGGGIGVNGNLVRGEIQTVPEMQRAVYVAGDANTFILVIWDWKDDRAGFPIAIELRGIQNRLITNQLPADWFARGSSTNIIDATHWRKYPEFVSVAPGGFFNEAFAGLQDDMLLGGHLRHSVTTSFGASPTDIARLFNADPTDNLICSNCATGTPQSITVTLAAPDNGIGFIGAHFGQSRRALKVAISVDTTGLGNWVDLLNMDTTAVDFGVIATRYGTGIGNIHGIRITFEGYAPNQSAVWLCRLWAFSRTPGSLFVLDSVAGSRSSGAALANLLTVLARKGIIANNTTA